MFALISSVCATIVTSLHNNTLPAAENLDIVIAIDAWRETASEMRSQQSRIAHAAADLDPE